MTVDFYRTSSGGYGVKARLVGFHDSFFEGETFDEAVAKLETARRFSGRVRSFVASRAERF